MKRRFGIFLLMGLSAGLLAACDDDSDPTSPTTDLPAPSGVAVSALSHVNVRVSFAAVSGATEYVIERAPGASGGTFAQVGTTSTPSYEDGTVQPASTYRYRVQARGGANTNPSPFSGEAQITTPAAPVAGPKEATISADITANRTLYADTVYQLSGFIKVGNGATLTVQPGTKIVGDFDIPGSSLFILRGARIVADGTVDKPIVFTSERPVGQRQPGDWGGIIIIGNGITNRGCPSFIEGTGTDATLNPLQDYCGGTNNDDNSGILRYVRVEFAGFPTAPNEELNSITMAAVGRGTTIEYVQALLGLDDHFEWFGGAVNGRYLVSYEASDDHFDGSEGWVGHVQFAVAYQSVRPEARPGLAGGVASDPQGIENDGCWAGNCLGGANNSNAQPYTIPVFANFTLIGPGNAWQTSAGERGMMLRRGVGGLYVNAVVARYRNAAVSLRGQNTQARIDEGNLALRNIYFGSDNGVIFEAENLTATNPENRQFVLDLAANNLEAGTASAAQLFAAFPQSAAAALAATGASFDWRPAPGSPIATGGLTNPSSLPAPLQAAAAAHGITFTSYRGAADPNGPARWQGWTTYSRN